PLRNQQRPGLGPDNGADLGVTARSQNIVGIRKKPRDTNGTSALIDLPVGKIKLAGVWIRRAVRQNQLEPQFLVRCRAADFRGKAFSPRQILWLSDREINLDRIHRRNGGDD